MVTDLYVLGKEQAEVRGSDAPLDISMEMLVYALSVGNYITKLVATLEGIDQGQGCLPLTEQDLKGGVKAAKVWPTAWSDALNLVLPSVSVDVYLEPGKDVRYQEQLLTPTNADGMVCAMLGAGNHGFLAVKDVLVAMFEKNQVVLLKPHPMQAKWQVLADRALAPLASWGYYASVACHSLEESKHMLYHPLVDAMHMTGGIATHDAVVWGTTKEEQERRKASNDPLLKVPITSELGCVSPAIIVGGQWTARQIESQAKNIAMGLTNNNSCNCNAVKILVLPGDWPQADTFVSKLKEVLSQCPLAPAYYPGIQARYKAWHDAYPSAEVITAAAAPACRDVGGPCLPYLVHTFDEVPDRPLDEYAFQNEPFAPVLNIVRLPTAGTPAFLAAATAFANDSLWGSLSATLVVSPQEEALHAGAVQAALQGLRYGMIGVNSWTGTHFMLGAASWGAFNESPDSVPAPISPHPRHPSTTIPLASIVAPDAPRPTHMLRRSHTSPVTGNDRDCLLTAQPSRPASPASPRPRLLPAPDPEHPTTSKAAGSGVGLVGNPYLVRDIQKTVFRTPMVGAAVPVPTHMKPLPRFLVLLVTGYTLGGIRGVLRALLCMKRE
ncbi:MAG: hypothetical protein WDW36_001213 [Sanguina aurantia]